MELQQRLFNAISEMCSTLCILDERQRRLLCGSLAKGYGFGGARFIAGLANIDQRTVSAGIAECASSKSECADEHSNRRVRKVGGGRKPISEIEPELLNRITEVIEGSTYGDPERILLWTNLSLRDISDELRKRFSIKAGKDVVSRALDELGYSKQANQKLLQVGPVHPGRDEIFKFTNEKVKEFIDEGCPCISVDTKKKELIGNFKNNGVEYRPKHNPRLVNDHDFGLSKVAPYGIYVENDNTGFVNLGTDHDTSEFAAESIRRWWYHIGRVNFPNATKLLITCDGGGSNGWRVRLWKYQMALLAVELGIEIHVCHLPPGTSKWNKVEHRLFCYITKNWEGKPLIDIQTVIKLISSTTTTKGLKVECVEDKNKYEKGVKVSDEQMKRIDIRRVGPYGEFSYIIKGLRK